MVLKDSKVCPSKHRNVLDIEELFKRRYFPFFLRKPPLFNLQVNRLLSIHAHIPFISRPFSSNLLLHHSLLLRYSSLEIMGRKERLQNSEKC